MDSNNKRPLGVTIIAILLVLFGVISLSVQIIRIYVFALGFSPIGALENLISAVLYLIFGYGLLKRNKLCWWLSIVFIGVKILIGLVGISNGTYILTNIFSKGAVAGEVGGIIIFAVFLYYLIGSKVRKWFGINISSKGQIV